MLEILGVTVRSLIAWYLHPWVMFKLIDFMLKTDDFVLVKDWFFVLERGGLTFRHRASCI